ncbi:MAG: MFS transporter [Roseiflexaceae bacterium]|nr:MFS transporter [Roseiflexaceae bacterium]
MLMRLTSGRFYYGWVIVLTLSLTQLTSWGVVYYGFGVLMPAISADLGWSRTILTGGFSLALLASGIVAVPIGHWIDQHGTRRLMTIGSIAATLLLLAWSQISSVVGFYVVMIGLGLAMAAILYEPAFAAITIWFRRDRSRALAVLTFFGGLASLIYIPLIERLVALSGWRMALVQLTVIVGCITILPHAVLLRRRPQDLGLLPDGDSSSVLHVPIATELLPAPNVWRSGSFWWLASAFSLTTLVITTLNVHIVAYLLEQGYPSSFAALAAGMHGLMSVSGRLTLAPLGGRLTLRWLTVLLFVMQAIAVVVLLLVPSQAGVLLYVAIFGLGAGAATPVRAALVAERYGSSAYGRINGSLTMLATWARVIAPVGAGALSVTIGYRPLLWGLACAATLAAGCVWKSGPVRSQESGVRSQNAA